MKKLIVLLLLTSSCASNLADGEAIVVKIERSDVNGVFWVTIDDPKERGFSTVLCTCKKFNVGDTINFCK